MPNSQQPTASVVQVERQRPNGSMSPLSCCGRRSPLGSETCRTRQSGTSLPRARIYSAVFSQRIRKIVHRRGRCCVTPGSALSRLAPRYPDVADSRRVTWSLRVWQAARCPSLYLTGGDAVTIPRRVGCERSPSQGLCDSGAGSKHEKRRCCWEVAHRAAREGCGRVRSLSPCVVCPCAGLYLLAGIRVPRSGDT